MCIGVQYRNLHLAQSAEFTHQVHDILFSFTALFKRRGQKSRQQTGLILKAVFKIMEIILLQGLHQVNTDQLQSKKQEQ